MSGVDKNMEHLDFPGVIPVDEDYDLYQVSEEEDGTAGSSYSIASSVYNFRVENGRRYHDYHNGQPFPNDEMSKYNETLLHEMVLRLLDNNYSVSPIHESSLHCVADVGTGLGLWAEGVAEKYPDTTVVGIDTTPHDERPIHPNLTYIISNVAEEWLLDDPSMKFDLVHIRGLFAGVEDWPALYKQCFENMNSGGWIEQIEVENNVLSDDGSILPNSQVITMSKLARDMTAASGRDFCISDKMANLIKAAGFVDVQEYKYKLPLGPWPADPKLKDVGKLFERFYKSGLQGWILHICTRILGWTADEVNSECKKTFDEIDTRQQHIYFPLVFVIGRKP